MQSEAPAPNARLDRYVIFDEIAAGGMATVHLGLLVGSAGFARTVAIKRLHPMFAKDPEFVTMFTDEARLAARIRHPNVAGTLDVMTSGGELFLVMEYIHGESLASLLYLLKRAVPAPIATAIIVASLHGLHAAHQATNERGAPLGVVHRDVSPQNIMIGDDGVARVLDFGIAKAGGRAQTTRLGEVKGKAAYMAPEQVRGGNIDLRVDVYSACVVLWEALTGHRLFVADDPTATAMQVLEAEVEPPSKYTPGIPPALDAAVLRGMSRDPKLRPQSALEMAALLEASAPLASTRAIAAWVEEVAAERLAARARRIREIEAIGAQQNEQHRQEHERPSATARLFGLARPKTVPLPRPPGLERVTYDTSSQVSAVSMATPIMPIPVRARRVWPWMFAAAGLVLVGMGAVIATRPTTSAPPDASVSAVEPTTSAPTAASSASVTPAPPPPLTAPPLTATTTASAATPASTPRTKRPTPPPKTPAVKRCNPPYTVDEDGIHIPKPECE